MSIKITSTAKAADAVKLLVHGRAGVGKTMLCATAPSPLIISAESGLLSLASQDIPVIEITSIEELKEVYDFVTQSDEAKIYETICLDSITEIAEVLLSEEKAAVSDARQAYGQLADKMTQIIRDFRDLKGKNVYFSAKQGRFVDDHTGIVTYQASMPGKTLTQGLSFFFDEVACLGIGQTEKGDDYRYLQTAPDISYDAKDRSGNLDKLEEPNLTKFFNKCLGKPQQEYV